MWSNKVIAVVLLGMVLSATANAADFTVDQKDKSFQMNGKKIDHLTIKVGDTVHFRNEDPWFHNIFSLSDVKTFDLGSYPKGQSKAVTFDKPGEAEIECAIHPVMYMVIDIEE